MNKLNLRSLIKRTKYTVEGSKQIKTCLKISVILFFFSIKETSIKTEKMTNEMTNGNIQEKTYSMYCGYRVW